MCIYIYTHKTLHVYIYIYWYKDQEPQDHIPLRWFEHKHVLFLFRLFFLLTQCPFSKLLPKLFAALAWSASPKTWGSQWTYSFRCIRYMIHPSHNLIPKSNGPRVSLQGYGCYGPRCYQWLFVRWETAVTTTPTWISWDVCVHSHLSDPIGTASTVLEFQSANRQCGDLYPLPKGCHVM